MKQVDLSNYKLNTLSGLKKGSFFLLELFPKNNYNHNNILQSFLSLQSLSILMRTEKLLSCSRSNSNILIGEHCNSAPVSAKKESTRNNHNNRVGSLILSPIFFDI